MSRPVPRRLLVLQTDLQSADESVRSKAIVELGESAHEEALGILFRLLDDPDVGERVREAFASSVQAHPEQAFRHATSELRIAALSVAGANRFSSTIDEVSRIIRNDADADMRCRAATTLGQIGDANGVPGLRRGAVDQLLRVRESVFFALTQIRHASAETGIVAYLDDQDWSLRQRARDHLENSGWMPTTRVEHTGWAIAQGRFDEVVAHGSEAIEPLLNAAVFVNDQEVRHWAAVALTKLKNDAIVDRLYLIAETGPPNAREAARACLATLGNPIRSTPNRPSDSAPRENASLPIAKESPIDLALDMLSLLGH